MQVPKPSNLATNALRRLRHATEALRGYMRRRRRSLRRAVLRLRLTAGVRFRRQRLWLRAFAIKIPSLAWAVTAALSVAAAVGAVAYRHRAQWQANSETLASNGILPQLEIAIGAAVLGVIGIVFSLSIFSIQQVAERGTAITLREYAQDWVFRVVYWILALFIFLSFLTALQRKEWAFYGACLNLVIVAAVAVVLKAYFNRAIKFVDPHFTISKVANRGKKSLKQIQRMERAVRGEIRYQRARKPS
jgi:uncharacterized membrane protein